MTPRRLLVVLVSGASLALAGCRGTTSSKPPIHLNPNMDNQARLDPQAEFDFFADHRALRQPVAGTVATGDLEDDEHRYQGKVDGAFAKTLPDGLVLSRQLVKRGQERYGIYCSPCHDQAGTGNGPVAKRASVQPPSLHEDRIRAMPIGQYVDVITNGVRNMPAYGPQVPIDDRWAIATYVRTLQVSRSATFEEVPADVRQEQGWTPPPPPAAPPAASEGPATTNGAGAAPVTNEPTASGGSTGAKKKRHRGKRG
jgi:mono/diheme cytochrome c family protein